MQVYSNVARGVVIEAHNEADYIQAETALGNLARDDVGRNLLNEIMKHSTHSKQAKVYVTHACDTYTIPTLSRQQVSKTRIPYSETNERSIQAARQFALKGRFTKGDGSSATVFWNPSEQPQPGQLGGRNRYRDSQLTLVGMDSRVTMIDGNSEVTLAHALIHAMRIIKGTYTDDLTSSGSLNEERRAIGVLEYAEEPISENALRQERQMPLRAWQL